MKPEPGRAHGTLSWVVLTQAPQATRGTSACSQASNWKKSRCRQERRSRSCTGWEAAPQAGQLSSAPEQLTLKSMRLAGTSGLTFSTTHGGCSPNALVNSASTPTLKPALPAFRRRPAIQTVGLHTKRRGVPPRQSFACSSLDGTPVAGPPLFVMLWAAVLRFRCATPPTMDGSLCASRPTTLPPQAPVDLRGGLVGDLQSGSRRPAQAVHHRGIGLAAFGHLGQPAQVAQHGLGRRPVAGRWTAPARHPPSARARQGPGRRRPANCF